MTAGDRGRPGFGGQPARSRPDPSRPVQGPGRGTRSAAGPVASRYDALFVDLDGVVYRGERPVEAAPATLRALRDLGVPILFLTNNSARTPDQVAARLAGYGIEARPEDVLSSAQATAALLRREGWAGKRAFVIGERGVREALSAAGLEVVDGEPDRCDLVVVGWDRAVDYARLRRASLLVERGARLVATNADAGYPAPDGLWPGAGAILAVVTTTTGAAPTVVGKPARPLFEAAVEATGARRPLVVGDRLETDVAGARAMGWDSLLVLSGAAGPPDLLRTDHLPTYVGPDLSALLDDLPPARFRPARPEDLPAIRALLAEAGLSPGRLEERLRSTLVTGSVDATACLEEAEGFGLLRSVAVRKPLQGRGLGMLAVAAALAEGRRRGVRRVALFTTTARPFFERLGFRAVSREDLPGPVRVGGPAEECPDTAVAMLLDLAG